MPAPAEFDDSELKWAVSALEAEAPMTREDLERVQKHFIELARLMLVAGSIFGSQRYLAVDMANKVLARINGKQANPARQREREREEERLLPIE